VLGYLKESLEYFRKEEIADYLQENLEEENLDFRYSKFGEALEQLEDEVEIEEEDGKYGYSEGIVEKAERIGQDAPEALKRRIERCIEDLD
ncbi:MAG: hypothetical protein SVV03_02115, partial [Candidatus Nanohaloarchaea archaeon]|nr:hypothetical protein [Candidatus Nanohaloarchaea archaeon]